MKAKDEAAYERLAKSMLTPGFDEVVEPVVKPTTRQAFLPLAENFLEGTDEETIARAKLAEGMWNESLS